MSLSSDGISNVRAYRLAVGIYDSGKSISCPSDIIIEWKSTRKDQLHQIYVNGRLEAVTSNPEDRRILLPHRSSRKGLITAMVFAVNFQDALTDYSDQLDQSCFYNRVQLTWPQTMGLPYNGIALIFDNGGSGEVDVSTSQANSDVQLWACDKDKTGFGMSGFGKSDFGYDGSALPGLGVGSFGWGEFGFDAEIIEWQSNELTSGIYKFGIVLQDQFGLSGGVDMVTDEVVVLESPTPADGLELELYDTLSNKLVLCVC